MVALSADASTAHIGLAGRLERSGGQPPAFCMALRKHLQGARLDACRQVGFDRVAELRFTRGDGDAVCLVGEFMGRHSNLLLVGSDNRILDCIRHVSARLNRVRTLLPGYAHVDPPGLQRGLAAVEGLRTWVLGGASGKAPGIGLSPWLVDRVSAMATEETQRPGLVRLLDDLLAGAWSWTAYKDGSGTSVGVYPLPIAHQSGLVPLATQCGAELVHDLMARRAAMGRVTEAATALGGDLRAAHSARVASIAELERVEADAGRADKVREEADLLMANLHLVPAGASAVVVDDYYDPGNRRTIALDPDLDGLGNATRRYAQVKRLIMGAEARLQRAEQLRREAARLAKAIENLPAVPDAAGVSGLRARLVGEGLLRAEVRVQQQARSDLYGGKRVRSTMVDGWEVLWGENAEANDYLTSRLASPDDIWLHARAVSSAHVVIRTHRNPDKVPMTVIREAAALAGSHSAAKHSSVIAVDYTRKKYVRRPRSASPGQVLYTNERTINVSTSPSPTKPGT